MSNIGDNLGVRNLDQIQETEATDRSSRAGALVLASFGGACIVFAALALMRSPAEAKPDQPDPLEALVAASKDGGDEAKPERLAPDDVTFPTVLTDQDNPTTAMEAVRRRPAEELDGFDSPYDGPPPATDRLPVVPLPAQGVLEGLPDEKVAPGDRLREMANHAAREQPAGEMAEAGQPGRYQLQVSSFKKQEDADQFALALRRRGHRAHVEAAHVQGRGLWYRVRIGPFKYRRSADIYRQDFEAKERMVGFVVNPPKTTVRIASAEPSDEQIRIKPSDDDAGE
ncbi:MAG: SPOR domain-containing protein [Polyangiaceae bacterium]